MSIDITKDLDREINKKKEESEEFLQEAKTLLLTAGNQERDALVRAGLDSHINQVDHSHGIEIERAQFEKKFGGRIITLDEIEKVCLKYDLRFLESKRFVGKVDALAGAKLMELQKKGISFDSNDFKVMAPPKAFKLDYVERKVKDLDPALFYRVSGTDGGMYLMVHKWGKDFTFWRRFLGMFYKNVFNMISLMTIGYLLTFELLLTLFHIPNNLYASIPVSLVLGGGFTMITLGLFFKRNPEDWSDRTCENMWQSTSKRGRVN